jgi:hypothetical protein
MPHMFINRKRIHDLTRDRSDLRAQFRWETINAVVYKVGGLVFIIGSILFFPRFEAYADIGAWTFFVRLPALPRGDRARSGRSPPALASEHRSRSIDDHGVHGGCELCLGYDPVYGRQHLFPFGGGLVHGRGLDLHHRQSAFCSGRLHQRAADHPGRKPDHPAAHEPDGGDLRGGLGAVRGGIGALPLGSPEPVPAGHLICLSGLAVSDRQRPVFCRRRVQLLAGLPRGAIVFKKIPVTEKAAAVITLVLASVVVNLLRLPSVELVRDIAKIPSGLSTVMLPDPAMMPRLARGSLSVALVALTQGAGIGTALPNPDGSRANQSRDFIGQGVGNLVGSFFQSLATGGVSVAHRHQCARRRQNPYGRSLFGFVADSDRGPDGQSGGSCSVKRDRRYSGGCSYGIDLGPDSRRPSDLENVKRIGCHGTSDLWLGALYPPSVHDFFRGRAVHDPLHLCVRYGARRRSRGHRRR